MGKIKATSSLHHAQARKNIWIKSEPYPHHKPLFRLFDSLMYLVGLVIPLATIPQIIKIWETKSAEDLSLLAWSVFLIGALVYFMYGMLHKERPIIFGSFMLILVDIAVVTGILLFS